MEMLIILVIVLFIWNISLEFKLYKLKNEQISTNLSLEDVKTDLNKKKRAKKSIIKS